jgi:hypothetical protein
MIADARINRVLAAFAALLSPAAAFGHSSEFILAKVTPQAGRVSLELAIDCGGHPMIRSEAEARAVLGKVLRVQTSGGVRELGALAPLRIERRTQIDPDAPIPRDPEDEARPHQLVCALWSWKCTGQTVAFEVPPDAGQTLILWTPAKLPGETPRWVILLGGDVSPDLAIPRRQVSPWLIAGVGAGLAGVALPAFWRMRRKDAVTARSLEVAGDPTEQEAKVFN